MASAAPRDAASPAPARSPVGLGLPTGALLGAPLFLLPYGVAVLLLAGLGGAALGALFRLVVLVPIVRHLAADR